MEDIKLIIKIAERNAQDAANKYFQEVLGGKDKGMCGFAWVDVRGVRSNSKLGKQLVESGFYRSYTKTLQLWNPCKGMCQNIDTLYAGALAYAQVLKRAGIDAVPGSRLD